ncbi:MAG: hypothetical protein JWN41_268 [Thermoleophilia bacterium]|nr:hypothetical protein [Thermoleophilia bacterium]
MAFPHHSVWPHHRAIDSRGQITVCARRGACRTTGDAHHHSSPDSSQRCPRDVLRRERCCLVWRARSFAPKDVRVAIRMRGGRNASASKRSMRRRAIRRFRCWLRSSAAPTAISPEPVMRAANTSYRRARSCAVIGNDSSCTTISTREAVLLACWPPGPPLVVARHVTAFAGTRRPPGNRRSKSPSCGATSFTPSF